MLKKRAFLFMVIIGIASFAFAQEQAEQFSIGKKEVVHSAILDEDRNVYIFLPDGYSRSEEIYPVLYMLYSEAPDFHFNTGVVAGLSRMRMIPKMITVAFDLGDGRGDLTPTKSADYGPTSGGADNFLKFIKDELIPFIEKNYRTAPQRLFWSHSIGGLFGVFVLLKEPGVFHSVLVSSPWMVYDRDQRYILKNTESFLRKRSKQTNFLYICVGDEQNLIPEIEEFLRILEKNKLEGLTWKYVKMPDENHMSILARSLTESLRAFASN
ncbi:MAG: alpha/beta hydrolase-fold protein [Candidatus Aminicenantes bacterium]|nr:alpha/beta hydrolase-fold protein [Candidatus Aminicenantes bacterium]